ncbi:Imm1 family immunity protein [Nostoc sp.]|uniref:Imm1 family immunity protein n=1 Tax=Nostoc sp. TaxID=1180 RepID=UPI002FF9B8C2
MIRVLVISTLIQARQYLDAFALGVYPASSCVDLNTTLKAAKAFVELGTMEESVIWEKDEVVERV